MIRKKLIKCVLITVSFFVILSLFRYLSFINESEAGFADFVENTNFSLLSFISVLGLLSYIFRMGFNNFWSPEKSEEERLLPDQGAENIVPGYIEEYVVCDNCQKASIDKYATLTQCPLCKSQFELGKLIAKP